MLLVSGKSCPQRVGTSCTIITIMVIIVYLIIVFLSYSLQDFPRTSNTTGSDDCLPADKLFVWERVQLNLVYIALNLLSGVPIGSILGPLLFLVYVNDLPSVIDCDSSIELFADDSKYYRTILNSLDCPNLQNDLDVISEWSKDWRLRFNTSNYSLLHGNGTLSCTTTDWTLTYLPDLVRKRTLELPFLKTLSGIPT